MVHRAIRAIALLLAPAVSPLAAAAEPPTVTIAQGRLAGVSGDGLKIFKGIPYALPPIGERRWKPPAPAAHWSGVRDASAFGPSCIQPKMPGASIYADDPAATSEDCLTLNVWAPAHAAHAPVIVWIHGGSLAYGGSAEPLYDGATFAKRGVVFVSINYRLGVLGWLAHPELSAESPDHVSGNYGLLDQIAALRWVRANIAAFGGDARNVTAMGESAGAFSVTYLLTSPLARGSFDKAIAESPNMRALPELRTAAHGLPSAEAIGQALAAQVGAADLAALRAVDADALARAGLAARFVPQGTVDGQVLPRQLIDVLDAGEQAKVPLIAGFNFGEVQTQRLLVPPVPASAAAYEAEVTKRYGDLAPAFLALYPSTDLEASLLATVRDAVYGWAAERLVHSQAAAGAPAWFYRFDHCYAAATARGLCAFHASELPYVFGQIGADAKLPPNWPVPAGDAERALSDAMIAYWVGFAKTGVPGGGGLPAWPRYADRDRYMRFADGPHTDHDSLPGMFEMQDELVARRRRAGQQWFLNVGVVADPVPER